MANTDDILHVIASMAAAYPNFQLQKPTIDVYARLLSDIPAEMLGVAAEQAIAESKFFPTVAELRERVFSIQKTAANIPTPEEAWREVLRSFGSHACTESAPAFSHAAIDETVRVVGYRNIGMCDESNMTTMFAQFRDAYNRLQQRAETHLRMLPATRRTVQDLATALHIDTPRLNGRGRESQ